MTPPNLNPESAIALQLALARGLGLEGSCTLRFMVLRLHRFIFVNLVGLYIFPGGLMRAWVIIWVIHAVILIKM